MSRAIASLAPCPGLMYIQALGGEILNVLTMLGDEEGAVEEKVARFYITSIALALQYLHSLEVTQRNLHLGTSPLLRPLLRPRPRPHLRLHLCPHLCSPSQAGEH